MRETIQRKLRNVEEQKVDTESQKETLKSQIVALERGKIEELFYFLFLCVCVCEKSPYISRLLLQPILAVDQLPPRARCNLLLGLKQGDPFHSP